MDKKQFLSALEFGAAMNPFASPEENDAQIQVVQQRQQARAAQAETSSTLERYQQMFTKMKSEYDKLSESYDYVVADRDASQMVLKELREAAGIPREVVGQKIDANRSTLLQQEGLSHLIDKF